MYIYKNKEWPNFTWDQEKVGDLLAEVRFFQGKLIGRMQGLGFEVEEEATLKVLTEDVLKTSEIEGEKLDVKQVRSSIAKKLGIDIGTSVRVDRNVEGIVEILLDAVRNHTSALTKERLFKWHTLLFPEGYSGIDQIVVGDWRKGAMQVISGPIGREIVHYEAPPFDRLELEMDQFMGWVNGDAEDLVIKSAIAHFWFVTIHPFEDGNGRIGRAIADMLLARSEKSVQRFYSMSSQIMKERESYYNILEESQKGTIDLTRWIEWYLNCLRGALKASEKMLETILRKAWFWKSHTNEGFNERQRLLINRLLEGYEGKLTSSKWAKIGKCSQDTALRDINDLLRQNVLKKEDAGGRSTSYILKLEE